MIAGSLKSRRRRTIFLGTRRSDGHSHRTGSVLQRGNTRFKQLFQADAVDVAQMDACGLGGRAVDGGQVSGGGSLRVTAEGVQVQRVGVSARGGRRALQTRYAPEVGGGAAECDCSVIEYGEHLHEHFVYPCRISRAGRYVVPGEATGAWCVAGMAPARGCTRTASPGGDILAGAIGVFVDVCVSRGYIEMNF